MMGMITMKKTLPLILGASLVALTACSGGGTGDAAAYPDKPIELIVPYAPGGATDRTARILAESADEFLPNNQTFVVKNRPGGGSVVGLTALSDAKPDGYTVGLTMETGVATKPNTENLKYDPMEFEAIMTLVQSPQILVVADDAPWADFQEWVDWVKENPGKFKYGHSGVGSIGHLAMESISQELDLDIVGVPFGGGGESKQALLSGQVGGDIGSPADLDPKLNRPLVNLGEGIPGTEDIPELKDFGVSTGVVPWIGLLAPPETDSEKTEVIEDAFDQALSDSKTVEKLSDLYISPYEKDGDEFSAIIKDRYETIGELTETLGMKK